MPLYFVIIKRTSKYRGSAVVAYNLDSPAVKMSATVNKQKTAKGKLYVYFDFLSDPLNPPIVGRCPMLNFGTEVDDAIPVVKQIQGSSQRLTEIIEQGIANGEFKSDWNAKEFGIKAFAMIEGAPLSKKKLKKILYNFLSINDIVVIYLKSKIK